MVIHSPSASDLPLLEETQSEGNVQLMEREIICCFLQAAFMASINALVFSSRATRFLQVHTPLRKAARVFCVSTVV
jgi:hypothetical protein